MPCIIAVVYELSIERVFNASHALLLLGEREQVHAHAWRVIVTVQGDDLDDDGLLCDFHALEGLLDPIIEPFQNADLHRVRPFDTVNPSAELLAQHVAHELGPALQDGLHLCSVSVTEAPGCTAIYRP